MSGALSLETRMDDARASMVSVDSERAALVGVSEGGPMGILFAASQVLHASGHWWFRPGPPGSA